MVSVDFFTGSLTTLLRSATLSLTNLAVRQREVVLMFHINVKLQGASTIEMF